MALKIPLYDQRTVGLRPNPTPQMSPGAAPNLGAAVGHGLAQASDVFEKAREEADRTAAEEALNKVRGEILAKQQLYQQRTGTQVRDLSDIGGSKEDMLSDHAQRELDAFVANTAKDLNPRVAKLVALKAQPMLQNFGAAIKGHEYEQIKKVQDDTAATAVSQYRDMAVSAVRPDGSVDDAAMKDAIAQGAVVLKEHRMSRGDAEDVINAMTTKFTSESLKGVIGGLLNKGNSTDARRIIKDYEKFFTVEDRQKLGELTKNVSDRMQGLDLAHQAMAKFSDTTTWKINREEAYKWARATIGENPEALAHFTSNFDHLATARKADWSEKQENASDAVLVALSSNKSPALVNGMIDKLLGDGQIDGTTAFKLRGHAVSWWRQAEAHAKTIANIDKAEKYAVNMAALVMNPERVRSMSKEQILSLVDEVGPQGLMHLSQWKAEMLHPSKQSVQIDDNDWKMVLEDFGFSKDGKVVKKWAGQINTLRSEWEKAVEEETKAKGPLSRERKIAIGKSLAAPAIVRDSGWFSSKAEVPSFTLPSRFVDMVKGAGLAQDDAPMLEFYLTSTVGLTRDQMYRMSPDDVKKAWNEFKKNTPVGRK